MDEIRLFDPETFAAPSPEGAAAGEAPAPDGPLLGPGGRPFTPEQAAAITAPVESRILSATAGSGKTSVLVERFVRSVREGGLDPRRILAITFTEKAAAELRKRIRERFLELGDRTSARGAESAQVSTIHAFCAGVLRGHALAASLDPRFRVLDAAEAQRIAIDAFEVAMGDWLDDAAAAGPERLELAAAYKPDPLRDAILAVHEQLRTRGHAHPRLPLRDAPDPAAARAEVERTLAAAAPVLAAAKGGVRVEQARDALTACRGLVEETEGVDGPPAAQRFEALGFSTSANALKVPEVEAHRAAVERWRKGCADILAAAALELLDGLLDRFGTEYERRKRERSAVDYADLELLTRDLLEDVPGLREAVGARFDALMVDEFQDTNPLQVALLDLLDEDRTMVVGDEFQSIYGFRHADVAGFRDRRSALGERGRAGELSVSFRARRELVDAVDVLFAERFGDGFVPLAAREGAPPRDSEPRVELYVTAEEGWEDAHPDIGDSLPPSKASRHAEARLLAQRVAELVQAGDVEEHEVAVLVRVGSDIAVYERALRDAGLGATVTGGRGYWESQQVRDLAAHLSVLANGRDERRLFELLGSPLVGLSSDGLAIVAKVRRDRKPDRDAWWTLTEAFLPGGDGADGLARRLGEEDRARLARWVPWFAAERLDAPRHSPARLIERAVLATGYDLHVLSLTGGERRMANVRKLQRLAREHETSAGADLRAFLELVKLQQDLEVREPEAPVEGAGVQLMTIHAAKGLEFDVVCLADLGRNGRGDGPVLRVDGAGRVGLRVATIEGDRAKALDYDELESEAKEREALEELRVFYVAATRARHRLILSGAVNTAKWPEPNPRGIPLSWLGPAIDADVAALAPGDPVREVRRRVGDWELHARVALNAPETVGLVLLEPGGPPGEARPEGVTERHAEAPLAPAPGEAAIPGPPTTLSYSSLGDYARCGYRYYLQRIVGLPDLERRPRSVPVLPGGIPGLERGSVVHGLLERMDPHDPVLPDREEIVERVVAEGIAEPRDEDIDDIVALVRAYLDSPLAARMAAAGDVRREAGFTFLLDLGVGEPSLVTGFVDAIAREGERAVVVDYKTDRVWPDMTPEDVVARDYRGQRVVYALAALHEGAAEVDVAHCFLERAAEPAVARFTAADVPALEDELRALARGIVEADFPVAPVPHAELCHGCPGRGTLCSWSQEMTERPAAEAFNDDEPPGETPDGSTIDAAGSPGGG
jgi:ATP-dependent helicase/nuclease subunit A